jgi:hypothetical protein
LWLDPRQSGGFTFNAQGGLELWGVPILWDPNFDTNTGTTKRAIAKLRTPRWMTFADCVAGGGVRSAVQ